MKRLLILLSVTGLAVAGHTQEFQKGTNMLSAGIGLGSSILSYQGASQSPALSLQYERGIWDIGGPGVISLGGYVGYKAYSYSGGESNYSYSESWHYTVVGIRSAYHYNGLDAKKLDLYGGLMLAYNLLSFSYSDNSGSSGISGSGSYGSTVGLSAYVGARYFFAAHFAVLGELGYGVAYLNIGIAAKF